MADMKRRIKDIWEKKVGTDTTDLIDELDEFEDFDDVHQYAEEFVTLDDLLVETKKRKVAADKIISEIL